jgi:hypothetical protein
MRSIGLDIHRDFAEVAIAEGGEVRSAGRIEMTPEALELFAQSLGRFGDARCTYRAGTTTRFKVPCTRVTRSG